MASEQSETKPRRECSESAPNLERARSATQISLEDWWHLVKEGSCQPADSDEYQSRESDTEPVSNSDFSIYTVSVPRWSLTSNDTPKASTASVSASSCSLAGWWRQIEATETATGRISPGEVVRFRSLLMWPFLHSTSNVPSLQFRSRQRR